MNLYLLKRKILQLAFSGNIVKNNKEDKIDLLLNQIKMEKNELIKKNHSRNELIYNLPEESEQLFQIPNNWKWIRIGELGVFKKGPFGSSLTKDMFVPKSSNTIKVYEQQNAIKKSSELGTYYITKNYFEEKMRSFEVKPGDIIVSCAGTIGECYVMPENIERGIINQALMKMTLVESIDKEYFLYYFDYILKDISNEKGKGTGMKNIPPFDIFKQLLFPLPPKEEQRRIIETIKRIEQLINEIENRKLKIDKLKGLLIKKILSLAICGNFTKKTNGDFNKEYNFIIEKKQKLTRNQICLNSKILDIDQAKINLSIPNNWKFVRLGKMAKIISKGTTPKGGQSSYLSEGINYLRAEGVSSKLKKETFQFISEKIHNNELKRSILEENDLLITIAGTLGRTGIVRDCDLPLNTNQAVSFIRFVDLEYVNPLYIMYMIDSDFIQQQLFSQKKETSIPNLTLEIITNLIVPMPPKEEQDLIVSRVEQLLELIDKI